MTAMKGPDSAAALEDPHAIIATDHCERHSTAVRGPLERSMTAETWTSRGWFCRCVCERKKACCHAAKHKGTDGHAFRLQLALPRPIMQQPGLHILKVPPGCSTSCCVAAMGLCVLFTQANLGIIRKSPQVAILPVLKFVVLVLAGELAIHYAAVNYTAQRQETALGVAQSAAEQLGSQLSDVLSPLVAAAVAVKRNPDVQSLTQTFSYLCEGILKKEDQAGTVSGLTLAPWGVNTLQHPLTRQSLSALGMKLLEDPQRSLAAISSIRKEPDWTDIIGPVSLVGRAKPTFALLANIYLWLPNVTDTTFGLDKPISYPAFNFTISNFTRPERTLCGSACAPRVINGTIWTFWGWISGIVTVNTILNRLQNVEEQGLGYKYVLQRKIDSAVNNSALQTAAFTQAASSQVIFQSDTNLYPPLTKGDRPQCFDVPMPAVAFQWEICIVPRDGWEPAWKQPLEIVVPFIAFLMSVMLFATLLSERRFSMLVKRMLPSKVVKHISMGETYAEPFQQVTILFSDIVSYTDMSSSMSPCELVELLNTLYSHFDALVDKHGLYKVETIGDAFMCVGGAPDACDPQDAAVRVARMALDMVDFARTYVHKDGRQIQIRVGMYTGNVTAAVIGKKMPHWCLVGDTVNVASRMETNSKPMHVHVGSSTAKLLEGCPEFTLQPRGKINIKGKGLMGTFFVWAAGRQPVAQETAMPPTLLETAHSPSSSVDQLITTTQSLDQQDDSRQSSQQEYII